MTLLLHKTYDKLLITYYKKTIIGLIEYWSQYEVVAQNWLK